MWKTIVKQLIFNFSYNLDSDIALLVRLCLGCGETLESCQSSHGISNASSHIQYSHNLLSLLNRSLIALNSAEWTEMLEICICSLYRSPLLLPGCIFNIQFLSCFNVRVSVLYFQAPSRGLLDAVEQELPETFYLLFIKWEDILWSWLHSSYNSVETVSQAQKLFPLQHSQPHSRAAGKARTQMLLITKMQPILLQSEHGYHQTSPTDISYLPDRKSRQNWALSPVGPPWTFSGFYICLGINLEEGQQQRVILFYGPESEHSAGRWDNTVEAVWIKEVFPTLMMELSAVPITITCFLIYCVMSRIYVIYCVMSRIYGASYFFPLPLWLLISLSSSFQVSKTIFCIPFTNVAYAWVDIRLLWTDYRQMFRDASQSTC